MNNKKKWMYIAEKIIKKKNGSILVPTINTFMISDISNVYLFFFN